MNAKMSRVCTVLQQWQVVLLGKALRVGDALVLEAALGKNGQPAAFTPTSICEIFTHVTFQSLKILKIFVSTFY